MFFQDVKVPRANVYGASDTGLSQPDLNIAEEYA